MLCALDWLGGPLAEALYPCVAAPALLSLHWLAFLCQPGLWGPCAFAIGAEFLTGGSVAWFPAFAASLPHATAPVMALRGVCLGAPWQRAFGALGLWAWAQGLHWPGGQCRLFSVVVACSGARDLGWGTYFAVEAAWCCPTFPEAAPPPPPAPAPCARGGRVLSWHIDTKPDRRSCCCSLASCREPIQRGDLRVRSAGHKVNPRYFHASCVEGGLGPAGELGGLSALSEVDRAKALPLCDRPGVPTRAEYVQDTRRAKRVCAAPGVAASAVGFGVPLVHEGEELPAALPEDADPTGSCEGGAAPPLCNLGWWDSVSYDSLRQHVRTLGKVPSCMHQPLASLRGDVAAAILAARAAGDALAERRALKLFVFFDRVFLHHPGRARGGRKVAKGGGVSHAVSRRLRLAGNGDWGALWREAMAASAPGLGPPVRPASLAEDVRAVESLLSDSLVSKAQARACRHAPLASGRGVHEALQALFPSGTPAVAPAPPPPVDASARARLVAAVRHGIAHSPLRSGPGPSGARFEHWRTLVCDSVALEAVAQVVVLFLFGEVPVDALDAALGARLVPLRKPNGKLRPLACGSVIRRLGARAVCAVYRDDLRAACGPHQYAVGRRAGCELVHKSITALVESVPGAVVLAFDATNAYNSMPRQRVLDAVCARAPALFPVAHAWLGRPTQHLYWGEAPLALPVCAACGVDQGCPLSPSFFALGLADALGAIDTGIRSLSPDARVFSYLDDIMVVVPGPHAVAAGAVVEAAVAGAGLQLEPSKTQAWSRDPAADLPEALRPFRVESLRCLGNAVPWLEQAEERVAVHAGADSHRALAAATAFRTRLRDLCSAGLSVESAHTLLHSYAQGCVTHHLRANYEQSWLDQLDDCLFGALGELLGSPLDASQRTQATLRLRDGGCAFPSARARAAAAFAGSWGLVLHDVALCLGVSSLEEFRARCPLVSGALAAAEADVRSRGGQRPPVDWGAVFARPCPKLQGAWSRAFSAHDREALLSSLGEEDRLALRGCGGPGAGAWLLPRGEGDAALPDAHYRTALRLRLRAPVSCVGARCAHRRGDGTLCGELLDAWGWHARQCGIGGSRDARHDGLRDWHAAEHTALTGFAAPTEQRVPAWDRVHPDTGVLEQARLDVVTSEPVEGRKVQIDWSVTCEHSTYAPRRHARSNKDGLAASNMVDVKRHRYPPSGGLELVPMVFETGGRPSDEAITFLRTYGHGLEDAERAEALGGLWRRLSRKLQFGNAEMVLSASP